MGFLDDYEPVDARLERFYSEHPDGRVITELLHHSDERFIVHATIYRDHALEGLPWATGLAQEQVGQGNVNRTSALENCETSAIGRALANAGYAAKGKRPSREEMAKSRPDPEADVKAAVFAAVTEAYPSWTEKLVKDACAKHYPAAVKVLEGDITDAGLVADTVVDLIKAAS